MHELGTSATHSKILLKMNFDSWSGVRSNLLELRDGYNVNVDELRRRLGSKNVFTEIEAKKLHGIGDIMHRFDETFEILFAKNPQTCVPIFLDVLNEMGRGDVMKFLKGKVSSICFNFCASFSCQDIPYERFMTIY